GLTEITLPASLETLGCDSFRGCTNLKTVTFEEGSNLSKIGRAAFEGCISLTNIVLPEKLETIEYSAFEGCAALTNITIPASVTLIDNRIFKNCSSLEAVTFGENSKLTYIPQEAFIGTIIKNIAVPASVEEIHWGAFENLTSLESVVFEENSKLKSLNDYAVFSGCTGLTEITLPASLETLGCDSFRGCTNLKTVTFEEGSNLSKIGRAAFKGCSSLTNIVLPEKLETIEYSAFEGCASLEHINLNNTNATTIEYNAFYGCTSLSKVILPSTLKSLGKDAFDKCGSIKLYMDTAEPEVLVRIIDEGWPFEINETGIKDSEGRNLNSDNTYYKLSQKLSSGKNGVSLTLKYDFKETVKNNISNCNVSVKVPSTVAFNTSTVTVNGVKWSDVSTGSNGTILEIKNVPSSGTIEFKVILTDASYFVSYAKIGYKLGNKSYDEVIGIINSINDMITLNAPSETSKKDITVSGMASPEKNVDLYVNGEYSKTVITSKTGAYSEKITLPAGENTETFTVEAKINNGKNTASAIVIYSNDAVMITSAKMIYRGNEYDLIANQGKLPVISWSAGSSFSFIIKVDNPDAVKAVYVVSQKAGGNNALLCEYNEDLDAYTATGFKGIVPGSFSIRCITNDNVGEYEDTIEQLGQEVENAILSSENITMTSTDNS
ncbi:MAG: leucine-rich repeat protein, partial [Clostridia bacterium]|nr:leucine-rich repeat protein [Clostridia bacterium]